MGKFKERGVDKRVFLESFFLPAEQRGPEHEKVLKSFYGMLKREKKKIRTPREKALHRQMLDAIYKK